MLFVKKIEILPKFNLNNNAKKQKLQPHFCCDISSLK